MCLDILDIIAEVYTRFGNELSDSSVTELTLNELVRLLQHQRQALRKRAVLALGQAVLQFDDTQFKSLFQMVMAELKEARNSEQVRTWLSLCISVSRSDPIRFSGILDDMFNLCVTFSTIKDDEVMETYLQAIDSWIQYLPHQMMPNLPVVINVCLEAIAYDPNCALGDDDFENELMADDSGDASDM